jgi:hypothetical protein
MPLPRFICRPLALLVTCTLAAPGCATSGPRLSPQTAPAVATPAIAEFVQKLPLGSHVQVDRREGRSVRGTLLKATADLVIVQPGTRLPEPPIEIAMADIVRVQPMSSNGRSLGKAIGVGAAAGAGAALGVFLILLAIFSD